MTDVVGVEGRAVVGLVVGHSPFDLATTRRDHGIVVKISGDLALSTAPRLRDELVSLANQGMPRTRWTLST